jgi:tartrate-resistant acid phosphatase type 5
MSKIYRCAKWIALLSVTVGFFLAAWQCRHAIEGGLRKLSLPKVDSQPAGTTRFAVIGDYGSGDTLERDVALLIDSWKPEFIATLGDNNYPSGNAETIDKNIGQFFHAYISPYKGKYGASANTNRFFPIPGHRDWDSPTGLQPYLDYFTLPGNGRYYDVVWGPVHLFMVDSAVRDPDGATADSIQGRWLQQKLGESTGAWKLVFAHHAPYTSHTEPDTVRMRWPFKAWGADAVLSGFYHVYERLLVDDIPYFVNGSGGTWASNFGDIDPHSQFRYRDDVGAMLIDANEKQIIFRFVSRAGQIIDKSTLMKN